MYYKLNLTKSSGVADIESFKNVKNFIISKITLDIGVFCAPQVKNEIVKWFPKIILHLFMKDSKIHFCIHVDDDELNRLYCLINNFNFDTFLLV